MANERADTLVAAHVGQVTSRPFMPNPGIRLSDMLSSAQRKGLLASVNAAPFVPKAARQSHSSVSSSGSSLQGSISGDLERHSEELMSSMMSSLLED
jgi:hypothetical protein